MGVRSWLLVLVLLPVAGAGLWVGADLLMSDENVSGVTIALTAYLVPLGVPVAGAGLVARRHVARVLGRLAVCLGTLVLTLLCISAAFALTAELEDEGAYSCPDRRVYC
jgi:hypothetical protein